MTSYTSAGAERARADQVEEAQASRFFRATLIGTMGFALFTFAAALWMLVAADATPGDGRAQVPAPKDYALRDRRTGASPPRR